MPEHIYELSKGMLQPWKKCSTSSFCQQLCNKCQRLLSVEERRILYVISGYPRAQIVFSKPGYLMLGFLETAKGAVVYVLEYLSA